MKLTKYALAKLLEQSILHAEDDVNGVFDNLSLMIYVNNVTLSENTALADLTEGSWTGYARQTAVAMTKYDDSLDTHLPYLLGAPETFTVTANATPQRAYGFALVEEGTPDKLIAVEEFDEDFVPIAGAPIVVAVRVGLGPDTVDPSGDLVAH